MSNIDYSAKLPEMDGVRLENPEESEKEIVLQISLERRSQVCGRCGAETERVHDYRVRQVRDLELRGKKLRLLYRRRRYVCPACGKRFAEKNTFVGRYMRFTHRTGEKILTLLRRRGSMKDVTKDTGTSISGVQRVLKMAPVSKPFPSTNSRETRAANAFSASLPPRSTAAFSIFCRREPWEQFRITCVRFPNAKIVIDRFHVVRYCTDAKENVRRSFQKALPKEQRKCFKRSRKLLLAQRDRLTEENRAAMDVLLRFSEKLLQTYALKEAFYDFMAAPNRNEADRKLDFRLESCDRLNLPEFKACRKMLANRRPYILNAFDIRLSNGFTEGCNSAVKTFKRLAFGFRNFGPFIARILLAAGALPYI